MSSSSAAGPEPYGFLRPHPAGSTRNVSTLDKKRWWRASYEAHGVSSTSNVVRSSAGCRVDENAVEEERRRASGIGVACTITGDDPNPRRDTTRRFIIIAEQDASAQRVQPSQPQVRRTRRDGQSEASDAVHYVVLAQAKRRVLPRRTCGPRDHPSPRSAPRCCRRPRGSSRCAVGHRDRASAARLWVLHPLTVLLYC